MIATLAMGRVIHIRDEELAEVGCTVAIITKLLDEDDESTLIYYTRFNWHGAITDAAVRGTIRVADNNWHLATACTYEQEVSVQRE